MNKANINKDIKLSEHFTLGELTKTSYITADGNIPSRVAIENLKNICENWLEDLRYSYNTLYGQREATLLLGTGPNKRSSPLPGPVPGRRSDIPVVISSGFRSEEVNRMCRGARGGAITGRVVLWTSDAMAQSR